MHSPAVVRLGLPDVLRRQNPQPSEEVVAAELLGRLHHEARRDVKQPRLECQQPLMHVGIPSLRVARLIQHRLKRGIATLWPARIAVQAERHAEQELPNKGGRH